MSEHLVIVGAGFAGLAAAFWARERGVEPLVIDAARRPGGAWARMPRSLRCLSPRFRDRLPDGTHPEGPGPFASAPEVAACIAAFEERHGFEVQRGVRVRDLAGDSSRLITTAGSIAARRVVVATGEFEHPRVPELEGGFRGRAVHSSELRDEVPAGPVLVVGAGNSGADVALRVAAAGVDVTVASRRPLRPSPAYPLGLRGELQWRLSGIPVGLLPPGAGCRHGVPLIGPALPNAVAAGGIRLVGEVLELDADAAVACRAPGAKALVRVPAATIVWATGFERRDPWRGPGPPSVAHVGVPCSYSRRSGFLRGFSDDARRVIDRLLDE